MSCLGVTPKTASSHYNCKEASLGTKSTSQGRQCGKMEKHESPMAAELLKSTDPEALSLDFLFSEKIHFFTL